MKNIPVNIDWKVNKLNIFQTFVFFYATFSFFPLLKFIWSEVSNSQFFIILLFFYIVIFILILFIVNSVSPLFYVIYEDGLFYKGFIKKNNLLFKDIKEGYISSKYTIGIKTTNKRSMLFIIENEDINILRNVLGKNNKIFLDKN